MRVLLLTSLLWLTAMASAPAQPKFDPVEAGRAAVDRMVKGDFAAVVATFDEKMRAALPEDQLRGAWQSVLAQAGAFKQVREPRVTTKGEYHIVVFPAEFERASVDIQVVFNGSGQMAGFNVRPAAAAALAPSAAFSDASYVSRERFSERDVTVDAGGWPLPGVLAIPNGAGPHPVAVLVHGSGPGDRDQTLGPNKPFRDLALGLASRGVAVLRYDKRTRTHGPRLAGLTAFTVKEEVLDDVVAAVKLLRTTAGIDPKRIFIAGHSLGGMLIPRIAAASGEDLRGVIVMAGAVRSLEQSIVDQTRYIAMADGTIGPDEQKQIDAFEQFAARVKTLQASDPPVSVAGISAPASYWVDLRGYHPPTAAQAVKTPMLILQGERDYQVTTEDFARWKAALGMRGDVAFKSYPTLNHLFIAGQGPSLPAEYLAAGHVAEEVVADIAVWVTTLKLR